MAASVKKRVASTGSAATPRASKPSVSKTMSAVPAKKNGATTKHAATSSIKKVSTSKVNTKKQAVSDVTEVKHTARKEEKTKTIAKDIGNEAGALKAKGSKPAIKKSATAKVSTDKSTMKAASASKPGAAGDDESVVAPKRVEAESSTQKTVAIKAPGKVARGAKVKPKSANSSLTATPGVKSTLNPSGAWPFPTGNRPK